MILPVYNREPWKVQELLNNLVLMIRDGWILETTRGNPVVLDPLDPIGFSSHSGFEGRGFVRNISSTVKGLGGCFPNCVQGIWQLRK